MPLFFFDVREGNAFFTDDEGLEHPDVDAAEREAAQSAAAIGRDRLPSGDLRAVTVEVRNEHGQRIITATASLDVRRVDPSTAPP